MVLPSASSESSVVEILRASLVDHVNFPVYIVTLWKVLAEVTATALFTPQGRPRDQTADGDEMESPPRV